MSPGDATVQQRADPSVSWFELFNDLVVVAAVTLTNDAFLSDPGMDTARAAVLGIVGLSWVWFLTTIFNNIFPGQDLLRRLLMVAQMGLIVTAALALDRADEGAARLAMLAYAGALLVVVLLIAGDRLLADGTRPTARMSVATVAPLLASVALCLVGAMAAPDNAPWLLVAALAVSMVSTLGHQYRRWQDDQRLRLDHLRERLGLFVLIILGEGFAQLVTALGREGTIPRADFFALIFLISFALWWIYFDGTFSDRLDVRVVRWRLSLLGHVTLVFGIAGTLDILVLLAAQLESELGPLVLRYFSASIATVLLSFALLGFAARDRLGGSGRLHVLSAAAVLVVGFAIADDGVADLYPVVGACAVVIVGNAAAAVWMDRTEESAGFRRRMLSVIRGPASTDD